MAGVAKERPRNVLPTQSDHALAVDSDRLSRPSSVLRRRPMSENGDLATIVSLDGNPTDESVTRAMTSMAITECQAKHFVYKLTRQGRRPFAFCVLKEAAVAGEVEQTGGFVNEVTRIGETIRRTAGPWTPAVHQLLTHLSKVGFQESPRPLGIDDCGREILTFIPGSSIGWTDWPVQLRGLEGPYALGVLLRSYHDAVRSFRADPSLSWRNPLAPHSSEIIRHGDFSPFNTIWAADRPVGIIDWDFAQPGLAVDDLAYLAWQLVPLQPDERARQYGLAADFSRTDRLLAVCDGYGKMYSPDDVVAHAIDVIESEMRHTRELAAQGVYPWTRFAEDGAIEAFKGEANWIRKTYIV